MAVAPVIPFAEDQGHLYVFIFANKYVIVSAMEIAYLAAAIEELKALPRGEQAAMLNALGKLREIGDQLPYPHSSQVKGTRLRELRPRAGRSPWRALYQRVGDQLVVAAICSVAQHDPRGFARGVTIAHERLEGIGDDR